jgi:FkbM family methyltransferase
MKYIMPLLLFVIQNVLCSEYSQPFAPYYSQLGQDKYLNENIFKGKRNGAFFDIGAHDGISYSNSYFFEKELGWSGVCIEPQEVPFKKLEKNRICFCVNGCVYSKTSKFKFVQVNGPSDMLSGLLETYDPRHHQRVKTVITSLGGSKEILEVEAYTLNDLCEKFNITHIDFVSIDTEGSENAIVKSIDFNKITIDVFVIENNYNENNLQEYLILKGYELYHTIDSDDIYVRIDAKKDLNI